MVNTNGLCDDCLFKNGNTNGLCDKIYKLKSFDQQRMGTKLKMERNFLAVFCIPESDKLISWSMSQD